MFILDLLSESHIGPPSHTTGLNSTLEGVLEEDSDENILESSGDNALESGEEPLLDSRIGTPSHDGLDSAREDNLSDTAELYPSEDEARAATRASRRDR